MQVLGHTVAPEQHIRGADIDSIHETLGGQSEWGQKLGCTGGVVYCILTNALLPACVGI